MFLLPAHPPHGGYGVYPVPLAKGAPPPLRSPVGLPEAEPATSHQCICDRALTLSHHPPSDVGFGGHPQTPAPSTAQGRRRGVAPFWKPPQARGLRPMTSPPAEGYRDGPVLPQLSPNPPRDDYAAAERAIGARESDGPGTIWGRGGRCLSSVAAGRLCDRLRMVVRAR